MRPALALALLVVALALAGCARPAPDEGPTFAARGIEATATRDEATGETAFTLAGTAAGEGHRRVTVHWYVVEGRCPAVWAEPRSWVVHGVLELGNFSEARTTPFETTLRAPTPEAGQVAVLARFVDRYAEPLQLWCGTPR